jgi:hypothetical protein
MNLRKFAVLLAALVLFSQIASVGVGSSAGAAPIPAGNNYQYSLINNGTAAEITSFNGTGTSFVIPSVIAGVPVTSIGERAFCNCTALTGVTIPNSVLAIGAGAFRNCYSLTSLTIPHSVTSIGAGAFSDVGLRTVVIPNSLKVIADDLFFDCYSLTSVTIPVSVTSIGNYSFGNCYQLSTVNIPSSVTVIGVGAFYNCGLRTAVIPESVSMIEDRCFQGCYALSSVSIPVSVTSLGNYSFYNCYALSSVTVPSNVSFLGDYLFCNCYNLISVTVAGRVTSMGAGAFFNCYDLETITFYDNAPSTGSAWKTGCSGNLTVAYYQGATGFTDPSWNGVKVHQMTSPNSPLNLTAIAGDCSVRLSWKAPRGSIGMASIAYLIYRNGTCVEPMVGTMAKIGNLTNGLPYNFTIVLLNTKGNLQNWTSVTVKLPILGVAVSGTACDVNGNPIANATVTLGNYTAVMTSEYGFFVFKGVTAGNYSFAIKKDGYTTVTQNVTASSSKNADLKTITLQANDTSASGGSGDMTLIIVIAVVGAVAGVLVYFLFFRKRKGGRRKKKAV